MQYDRAADGTLSPLPAKNIDTGAGLERMAALLQDVHSVFDTDAFRPLIAVAERRLGPPRTGVAPRDDRALRVLADHGRAMTFLAADGVRPGQRGPRLHPAPHRPPGGERGRRTWAWSRGAWPTSPSPSWRAGARCTRSCASARPRCGTSSAPRPSSSPARSPRAAACWTRSSTALGARAAGVSGEDAFRLHDTFGFPLDLTARGGPGRRPRGGCGGLRPAHGGAARAARGPATAGAPTARPWPSGPRRWPAASAATEFVGLGRHDPGHPGHRGRRAGDGEALLKLERSPFYAEGGGQVSDVGEIAGPGRPRRRGGRLPGRRRPGAARAPRRGRTCPWAPR